MLDMLPLYMVALMPVLIIGAVGGAGYLALRAVRAFERKAGASNELEMLRGRLELLEMQLEEQSNELRRVSDGQRFTERLLSDRAGAPLPPDEDVG